MIRHAILKDVPAILAMAKEFYQTTDYAKFAPWDEGTILDLTELLILQHIVVVAVNTEDQAVGVLGMYLAPFTFNKHILTGNEVILWVNPDSRKDNLAVKMIQYAEMLRKLRGVVRSQLALLNTSPEVLSTVYEQLGFNYSEKFFSKVG